MVHRVGLSHILFLMSNMVLSKKRVKHAHYEHLLHCRHYIGRSHDKRILVQRMLILPALRT